MQSSVPPDFSPLPAPAPASDLCVFLLLCQDFIKVASQGTGPRPRGQNSPFPDVSVWPTLLLWGYLFVCCVLISRQHLKGERLAMDFYSWLLFFNRTIHSF